MDQQNIHAFIKSRAPLFFITSHEEKRVDSMLYNIAKAEGMKYISWSFAAMVKGEEVTPFSKDNMVDLYDLLKQIIDEKDSVMVVLKDVGRIIKNQDPEPALLRRIKEFVINYQYYTQQGTQQKYKPLVMLDSHFTIPSELEKEAVVIDMDLISQPEIEECLKRMEDKFVKFEEKSRLATTLRGLTESEILNVLGFLYQAKKSDPKADIMKLVKEQKKLQIQKSEFLEYISEEDALSDVGGMDLLKEWLVKRRLAFTDEAEKYGLLKSKGILLVGLPGGGKSLISKAIANLWGCPCVRFDVGKLFNSLVGASERATRTALKTIDSIGNCVVWIDEIEKGMAGIHSSSQSDAGTTARVIGTILTWLQERKNSGSFIVATSNNIRQLPPELLRKGRFSEIFFVAMPSPSERKEIFSIHLVKRGRDPKNFDLGKLADASDKMVGAEIEEAINSSMFESFANDRREFTTADIVTELKKVVPLSVSMKEQLDDLWKWCKDGRVRFASTDALADHANKMGFRRELEEVGA